MTKSLFTKTTWADTLKGEYLTPRFASGQNEDSRQLFWDDQHDLAVQLAEAQPALTFEQARTLIEATCSGKPVTLTWRGRTPDFEGKHQVTTATVIVTELGAPGRGLAFPGIARVHYWGFGHPIYLDEITAVVVPETTYTWEA